MSVKIDGVQGVWRTIGGRRVFIKTGQNLSDAMKESGKFKIEKQKRVKKLEKENEELYKKYNGFNEIDENKEVKKAYEKWKQNADEANKLQLQYRDYEARKWEYDKEMPEGAKFNKMLEDNKVKTFADDIKENRNKILTNKELSNMTWEEVVKKNTDYYSSKSIYDFEGEKQGKYKYEDGWRDNGGSGVIKQSDIDKLITKEEWKKANKSFKSLDFLNKIDNIAGNDEKLQKLGRQIGFNSLEKYNKAWKEYRKEHPNSKIDLYKFIKMNEE